MTKYHAKSMKLHGKGHEDVGTRVASFLRELHPRKTAEYVSAATGIPQTTVATWLDRGSAPSSASWVVLTLIYGPDFLLAVLPSAPDWLDRAARAERLATLEAEQARIGRELEDLRR